MASRKTIIYSVIPVIILLCVVHAGAFDLKISGDRLSLHADQIPLQDILKRFADSGISVRIDPQLNPKISESFDDEDIRKGVTSILRSLNHVLLWESIEGPPGPITRLAEIQVFRTGKKGLMKPLGAGSVLDIARDPVGGSLFIRNEILLRLAPGTNLKNFKSVLRQIGGIIVEGNPTVGIYRIRLPEGSDIPDLVERLSEHPGIAKAEPNYAYPIAMPYRATVSEEFIHLDFYDRSTSGGTVPIAILDSGVISDFGLQGVILKSLDALNPDEAISDPLGHGTQMALIASGMIKPYGVSLESGKINHIVPIRAFDNNSFTSNYDIMESVDFAMKNGARVISLSWGSETRSVFLENILDYASSKGLFIVASAGNEPTGHPVYPAAYGSVIGVGVLGPDGKSWVKSNYGDFVSVYAPGFASFPIGYKGGPGMYAGSSISAAFAANIIANYLSQHPNATLQEILKDLKTRHQKTEEQ